MKITFSMLAHELPKKMLIKSLPLLTTISIGVLAHTHMMEIDDAIDENHSTEMR